MTYSDFLQYGRNKEMNILITDKVLPSIVCIICEIRNIKGNAHI